MSAPVSDPFFIIAGPTAVGKSRLAVEVAERYGGEVVNADAFQVYAGLEILTAKPEPELLARVPHHLVGTVPLTHSFDVAQFLEQARERIREIRGRGRTAIVCGGTGMYLRALLLGLAELPPADPGLRSELEAQPLEVLLTRLEALDPVAFARIDRQNPRRIFRALEVCLLTGRPFSSFREEWSAENPPRQAGVVLLREREELHARIDARTLEMFAAGVEGEVRLVGEIGPTAAQVLGLREIRACLAGEISREDAVAAIQKATWQYARRQMTWFRKEPSLIPLLLEPGAALESVVEPVVARVQKAVGHSF